MPLSSEVSFQPCPPPPAGYISGIHYKKLGGTNWVNNVLLTTVLFCGPVLVTFSYLNTVAIFYRVRHGGGGGCGGGAAYSSQ